MKWVIIVIAIIAVVGGIVFVSQSQHRKPPRYVTVTAAKSDLTQTVEATGSVASAHDLALSSKIGGKLRSVNVAVGDTVAGGSIVATIADDSLRSQVDRARAAVASAQADLDKLLSGPTPEEKAVSAEQVEKAKVDLASAQSSLANLEETHAKKKRVYTETALQALSDASFVSEFTLDVIFDGILDDNADSFFKTTKTETLAEADLHYNSARELVTEAKDMAAVASLETPPDRIRAALEKMRDALQATSNLLDSSFEALAGAVINTVYTQSTIDDLKVTLNARATAIASSKTSVQSSITNFTSGLQDLKTQFDEQVYKEKNAQRSLALAEANYAELIAPPQTYEIAQQRAKVLEAQADLSAAESNLSESIVLAPLAGTITGVDAKVGEIATANQSIVRMIGTSRLQIDVDIPESDITKIKVGQAVRITLDAFGPDAVFAGTVSFVEPSGRIIQDVVYYRVTVLFDDANEQIKPGMTATILIVSASRSNVIAIPLRAVTNGSDGMKTVRLLVSDGSVQARTITIGLRGDDGLVEVVAGVTEGESVIVSEQKK